MRLPTDDERLVAHIAEGVAHLVFDHPARRNALSMSMIEALPKVLALATAEGARVLVLSGQGGRAFVSGADISEFGGKRPTKAEALAREESYRTALTSIRSFIAPTISMIDGYCLGGGLGVALATDIRICSEPSQFGVPAARLGIAYGHVDDLVRVVGSGWAAEILYTGRRFSSAEALQSGLVNRVVPASELARTVDDMARQIADNAPLSVRHAKVAIRHASEHLPSGDGAEVLEMVDACNRSDDRIEGTRAFLERRSATFRGL